MADKSRHCPQCGSKMVLRLGDYDCSQCGHTEPELKPQAAKSEPPADYGGVKRAKLLIPPPGSAPPPPYGGASHYTPQAPAGTVYTPGYVPASIYGVDDYGDVRAQASDDTLQREKQIFYMLVLVGLLLYIIAIVLLAFVLDPSQLLGTGVPLPAGAEVGGGMVFGAILGSAISAWLYWWVLFSDATWGKWTCIGCQAIGFLGTLSSLLGIGTNAAMMQQIGFVYGGLATGVIAVLTIVQVGIQIWLITILYRDIQRLQGF